MPIWPCELAKFAVFLLLLLLFVLINFAVVPTQSQATCAFIRADFAQFVVNDTPAEPTDIADANLSLCRLRSPSVSSCCTRQMEAKFEQFARDQLHSAVSVQFGLIRNFFGDWSSTFRTEFSHALNRTERTLRHIFRRTYGHFFTQNSEMFDEFFSRINSLLLMSRLPSSASSSSDSFGDAFHQLLQRIFLAEFALLNPLRSSSDLLAHEQCMRNYFPAFAPFGSLPDAISALHGRTFAIWTTLFEALENAGEVMDSLGRAFSLSSHCVDSVVRMRFCPICLGGHFPQLRPCPAYCQDVLRRCLHNLTTLSSQWDGLIDSMVRLGTSLASVHNPHVALAPFPFQLSEAIMHFQENAQILSGRILFRCFGDDLQKIATERRNWQRRKKRNFVAEMEENFEEDDEEDDDDEEAVEEEAEWEEEERENNGGQSVDNNGQSGDNNGQNADNEENGRQSIAATTASSGPSSPLLVMSVLSLRRSVDRFVDGLLRMKRFWRGIGRMLCQEGGIQADVRGSDERCWDGRGRERWGDRTVEGADEISGTTKRTWTAAGAKFACEIAKMETIAHKLHFVNGGMRTEIGENDTEWGAEDTNSTTAAEDEKDENSAYGAEDNESPPADNYQSYESMGEWWHWTEVEKQAERTTSSGGRSATNGAAGFVGMAFLSIPLTIHLLLVLMFFCRRTDHLN